MEIGTFRNISFATAAGLRDLLDHGSVLRVRKEEVSEICNRITVLRRPLERCLFLHHRGNNIFASIAETLWVMAGRNDVAWLQHYLPRATSFSDDGRTWRGAYGPRLRNWNLVDQLDATRQLLLSERLTRRAVMVLYDPDRDFVESKDIPCNNWLHWMVRDDHLHLNVGVRSNDIIWGFSAVNSFEWSVLQEMMAYWIGVPVGSATYFASSFHLYDRHYEMATKITADFDGITCYDFGIESPPFQTSWPAFDGALRTWFELEEQIRQAPERPVSMPAGAKDPLLEGALQLLRLSNGEKRGWTGPQLHEQLSVLPQTDLTVAAYEFLGRKYPEILEHIPQPLVASFFEEYRSIAKDQPRAAITVLCSVIKALHRRKNVAYGDAWKRRGELTSILANIARKVDRLYIFGSTAALLADESILETTIDLYIYLTKYRLFLMEMLPESGESVLPPDAGRPFSDCVENFDALVDQIQFKGSETTSLSKQIAKLSEMFERLHLLAATPGSTIQARLGCVLELCEVSAGLLQAFAQSEPGIVRQLLLREEELRQ
jgi:thymidylate synthase